MNKNIKRKWCENKVFIVWAFVIFLIEIMFYRMYGDDASVLERGIQSGYTVWGEVKATIQEYYTWGARILVDIIIRVLLRYIFIWKVINAIIYGVLAKKISQLVGIPANKQWIIPFFILMFPQKYSMSAGWAVTSMTYLWTITVGFVLAVHMKEIICENTNSKVWKIIIMDILLVYFADIEQHALMATMLLLILLIFNIKRKCMPEILVYWVTSILMLAFHLLVPGNQSRLQTEQRWFLDFPHLSIINKLEIGFSSSIYEFIFEYNTAFVILTLLLVIIVGSQYKQWCYMIVPGFVGGCVFVFEIVKPMLEDRYSAIYSLIDGGLSKYGSISVENYSWNKSYISLYIMVLVILLILLSLYLVSDTVYEATLLIGGLIVAIGAAMAIGISPTIWASRDRTLTCLYFTIIAISVVIYKKAINSIDNKVLKTIDVCIVIMGLLEICNWICCI